MDATNATAQELVQGYHWETRDVSPDELDRALGLVAPSACETSHEPASVAAAEASASFAYARTPYPVCRGFFRQASPSAEDLIIDFGCGDGRLLIYGALTTPARFRGIELNPSRFEAARVAAAKLPPERVTVVHGDVLELDWSDGTIFYAFRPFMPEAEAVVLERLHDLGRRRPITIGTHRMLPGQFDPTIFEHTDMGDLAIYRSR